MPADFCEDSAFGTGVRALNTYFSAARRCTLLLAPLALTGCTFLEDLYSGPSGDARPEAVPLEARPVEEPIARNYFVLETETQSVIGAPQIVYTDAENTLSDLAREYGLGYDEIIAANPDVDPWLRATERRYSCPRSTSYRTSLVKASCST